MDWPTDRYVVVSVFLGFLGGWAITFAAILYYAYKGGGWIQVW